MTAGVLGSAPVVRGDGLVEQVWQSPGSSSTRCTLVDAGVKYLGGDLYS
ncbi:MAG: hypothetical protein H0U30_00630 [Actinobacteria bacterium]|nr:hypothetical protein [Actinomycetota bacterium]